MRRDGGGVGRTVLLGVGAAVGTGVVAVAASAAGYEAVALAVLGGLFAVIVVLKPFVGIVGLLGTMMLGLPEVLAGSGRLTANNALGVVLVLAMVVQIYLRRDVWFLGTPQVLLLTAIAVVFVLSLVLSWYVYVPAWPLPRDWTESTLFQLFSRLAFVVLLMNFAQTSRRILGILLAMLAFTIAVIPSALYNLATWPGGVDELTGRSSAEFRIAADVSSWGQNVNRLAFMCNLSILLIWMILQLWGGRMLRLAGAAAIVTLAIVVLATVSRSGFLSLGLVMVFLLAQRGFSARFRWSVAGATVACVLAFLVLAPAPAGERLLNLSPEQSDRLEGWRSTVIRLETNAHAWEVFTASPLLGVGPGNFRWLHRERYPHSIAAGRPTHNSYLWALTEGGVVAAGLYLLLFAAIFRDLWRVLAVAEGGNRLWPVGRFLMGYLLIFLFFSMFADIWLEPHLYLLAGLSALVRRLAEAETRGASVAAAV